MQKEFYDVFSCFERFYRRVSDIMHHWYKAVDEGQSVRSVFIELAKAFDHVDHNVLVAKLMDFTLPDSVIRWISSFLCHRRQRIKIGDVMSDWRVMNVGMPQGSYLGPLMFITGLLADWPSRSSPRPLDPPTWQAISTVKPGRNGRILSNEIRRKYDKKQ